MPVAYPRLFQLSSSAACVVAAREGTPAPARKHAPDAVCEAVFPRFPRSLHGQNRRSPLGNGRSERGGNFPCRLPDSLRVSLPVPCGVWVADGPLPVAPALPRSATSRVAGDQGGSGPVAGSATTAADGRTGPESTRAADVAAATSRVGRQRGRRRKGGEFSPSASPPCLPWMTCVNPGRRRRGRRGGNTPKPARNPGFAALSCLPPHPGPGSETVREAVREALGSEGVLPHASLAHLPRADLRKHVVRERGRHLPHRPETPENRVFRGCVLPPSLTCGGQVRPEVTPANRSDFPLPRPLPANQYVTRTNRQEVSQVSEVTQTPRHPAGTGLRQARPPPSLPPPRAAPASRGGLEGT